MADIETEIQKAQEELARLNQEIAEAPKGDLAFPDGAFAQSFVRRSASKSAVEEAKAALDDVRERGRKKLEEVGAAEKKIEKARAERETAEREVEKIKAMIEDDTGATPQEQTRRQTVLSGRERVLAGAEVREQKEIETRNRLESERQKILEEHHDRSREYQVAEIKLKNDPALPEQPVPQLYPGAQSNGEAVRDMILKLQREINFVAGEQVVDVDEGYGPQMAAYTRALHKRHPEIKEIGPGGDIEVFGPGALLAHNQEVRARMNELGERRAETVRKISELIAQRVAAETGNKPEPYYKGYEARQDQPEAEQAPVEPAPAEQESDRRTRKEYRAERREAVEAARAKDATPEEIRALKREARRERREENRDARDEVFDEVAALGFKRIAKERAWMKYKADEKDGRDPGAEGSKYREYIDRLEKKSGMGAAAPDEPAEQGRPKGWFGSRKNKVVNGQPGDSVEGKTMSPEETAVVFEKGKLDAEQEQQAEEKTPTPTPPGPRCGPRRRGL